MPNMDYCRFENTYDDLKDCEGFMNNSLDGSEKKYRNKLVRLCVDIAVEHGYSVDLPCYVDIDDAEDDDKDEQV